VLLQIMDHGRLTDHNGKQVNFRNVILIMTTQCRRCRSGAPGVRLHPATSGKATITRRSIASSRPNSATGSTPSSRSQHLNSDVIGMVVEKFVLQLEAQLADRDVTIELSEPAKAWLVQHGYDEQMGARPDVPGHSGAHQEAVGG